ncbi:MAG TPA: ABC transporter permease [Terriglobia bacterium]|nr:ABC transporter permease [Terriglobia bacterium]
MLRDLFYRLQVLLRRNSLETELDRELRAHVEQQTEKYVQAGMSPDEATRRARLEFGGIEQVTEDVRDSWGVRFLNELGQDLRYGLRQLRRNPGVTAVAVLTLALGIGANTAVFSVVDGVLLRPLPFPKPQELVSLHWRVHSVDQGVLSYLNFLDCRKDSHSFASMEAFTWASYKFTGLGQPELLFGERISAGFFAMLGIKPVLGRLFQPGDDRVGANAVALISERLWKRKFGSSPASIGRSIVLNSEMYTIVGVVPTDLPIFPPFKMDVFTPAGQWGDSTFLNRKVAMGTAVIGRLKPRISLSEAQADMDAVAHDLAEAYPSANKGADIRLVPLKTEIVGDVKGTLLRLLGAVGFVFLIACVNVAGLLLARFIDRRREFAIRTAVGGSWARITRQVLTESVLLATIGGVMGLAIAKWGMSAILASVPSYLPRTNNVHMNLQVLVFALLVSFLVGIGVGLASLLGLAGRDLIARLKKACNGSSTFGNRAWKVFIGAEMGLSIILLVGAGLMIRSIAKLEKVNPGFNPSHVLTFGVSFSNNNVKSPAAFRSAAKAATTRFGSLPGVKAASPLAGALPMHGDAEMSFWIGGQPEAQSEAEMNVAMWHAVGPGYLKVMGIPLIRGRFISEQDTENSPRVVVIDNAFARKYFRNEDPIGKTINTVQMKDRAQVIGVVGHVEQWGLGDRHHRDRQAQFYFPLIQLPNEILSLFQGVGMVVRTSGAPGLYIPTIRAASARFDPGQVVHDFAPMYQIVANSMATQRFTMILLGVFAVFALGLSGVGIYGLIAHSVSQRTHEIGIRMAPGAERGDVLRMLIGQGLRLALIGVAIGIVGALALTRFLSSMLYGVTPTDPLTFIAVSLILIAVALVACYIPARRAAKVDPMVALRYE